MVDLAINLTATGFTTAVEGRAILHAVAGALAGHGVTHLMVEADADDPQWTSARPRAPLSLTGAAKYRNALDDALLAAVPAACPSATAELGWEPAGEGAMARQERVVHAYRWARMFNAVDDGAVALGFRRRIDGVSIEDALLNAMADARVIAPIDWKASPDEVSAGLGQLRLLPAGDRTVAEAVGDCTAATSDDEQPYLAISQAVQKRLESLPAVLLELSNGDTPCFLAAPPDLVDELIEAAARAGFEITRP
jgi:hypothetical protein